MKIEVRLFARARDLAGAERVSVELPDEARMADLRIALAAQHPALERLAPHLLIAAGTSYADDSQPVSPTAEIACFPPVSGG